MKSVVARMVAAWTWGAARFDVLDLHFYGGLALIAFGGPWLKVAGVVLVLHAKPAWAFVRGG